MVKLDPFTMRSHTHLGSPTDCGTLPLAGAVAGQGAASSLTVRLGVFSSAQNPAASPCPRGDGRLARSLRMKPGATLSYAK
jgi:hypothetical protein